MGCLLGYTSDRGREGWLDRDVSQSASETTNEMGHGRPYAYGRSAAFVLYCLFNIAVIVLAIVGAVEADESDTTSRNMIVAVIIASVFPLVGVHYLSHSSRRLRAHKREGHSDEHEDMWGWGYWLYGIAWFFHLVIPILGAVAVLPNEAAPPDVDTVRALQIVIVSLAFIAGFMTSVAFFFWDGVFARWHYHPSGKATKRESRQVVAVRRADGSAAVAVRH